MIELSIVFSPHGDMLAIPRDRVTALWCRYHPPLRPIRRAPASLRAATVAPEQLMLLLQSIDDA